MKYFYYLVNIPLVKCTVNGLFTPFDLGTLPSSLQTLILNGNFVWKSLSNALYLAHLHFSIFLPFYISL